MFVNETEYHTRTGKRVSNLQQQVEEPDLYLIAVSSSSGSGLILDCLDCLLELSEPLCTSSGIQISDTLRFFLGEWGDETPRRLGCLSITYASVPSRSAPLGCFNGCFYQVSPGFTSGVYTFNKHFGCLNGSSRHICYQVSCDRHCNPCPASLGCTGGVNTFNKH